MDGRTCKSSHHSLSVCRFLTMRYSRLQINHLSVSLLTILLLPLMMATASKSNSPPRIVIATSDSHSSVKPKYLPMDKPTPSLLSNLNDQEYSAKFSYVVMIPRY